ncbi:hypothetical protein QQ045_033358 [Rhodiola kirilowii]
MKRGASSESRNNKGACPPSRPNSSLVKIDSIVINIDAVEQRNPEKCEHFTIRGYASDIRKQNAKLCCPFSGDVDDASSEEINSRLRPLHIPKIKSWRCQNCLNEIDVAGASEDAENITVNVSRQLKTKSFSSHRSLENVIAHLSNKLEQPLEPGRRQSEGTKSASESMQKQILDSAFHSNTRGLGETELRSTENGFHSIQQDSNIQSATFTNVDKLQKQLPTPSKTITTKLVTVDCSQHRRHAAEPKLDHNHYQHDNSIGTCRQKSKVKKIRLLNEIIDKGGKGTQSAMTEGFHADESAKVSCGAPQSVRCHVDQKRNKKYQEQKSIQSQMHNVDSFGGNGERTHDIDSAFANSEMHMTSTDGCSDAIVNMADKMCFGSEKGVDVGDKNYHDRGQTTMNDSCSKQQYMSTCQPFHGRATDSLYKSSLPTAQSKGKSNYTKNKVRRPGNLLAPTDNGKGLEGNSVPLKRTETLQIGHQSQSFQSIQDEYSSKHHYLFSDGCLNARKSTRYWVPQMDNGNSRNDIAMQYNGESSSACKFLVDKNILQGTNSNSGLKRPNQGSCVGNKKPKHMTRTERGPAVVHQTESSLCNINKKMGGTPEIPKNTLREFGGNKMQEVGNSDDIPMDIVEHMAKCQYERNLHEVGDDHNVLKSGSDANNDLVGSTSMLPYAVSRAPLHEKPYLPNSRVMSVNGSGISNGKPNSYLMQIPSTGSAYRPLLSSQRELSSVLQPPPAGSSKTDFFQNCKYDMNKFASEQIDSPRSQAPCGDWQPASRPSDRAAHAWPMAPPNNPVHMPGVFQGNAFQPFYDGKVPKRSSYVGECRDFNNLGLADSGNKFNNFRAEASQSSLPNRVEDRPQVTRSPDPYANEALSAMHLLSLMNGSSQSNMGAISNRKTFDKSFSNDHLAKELSENTYGVGKSSHKFNQPSTYSYHNSNLQAHAFSKCSTPVSAFGSAVMSPHGHVGNKRGIQPSSQHPERVFWNGNTGGSLLPAEKKNFEYQKSWLTSTGGVAFQELIPARELANHIFSSSSSVRSSSHSYMNGNFSKGHNSVAPESYQTLNRCPDPRVCCINRNPMDFTTPGLGNEYMIGAEDLKLRKTYPPNITRPVATNSFQQQRLPKYTTLNNRL